MNFFELTAPNTCAFVYNNTGDISFFEGAGSKIWPAAGLTEFIQFLTKDDAFNWGQSYNPPVPGEAIFGPIPLSIAYITPSTVTLTEGQTLTLECQGETDPGLTISYEWKFGDTVIGNAPTLELADIQLSNTGEYTCHLSVSGSYNRSTKAEGVVEVTVEPATPPSPEQ